MTFNQGILTNLFPIAHITSETNFKNKFKKTTQILHNVHSKKAIIMSMEAV